MCPFCSFVSEVLVPGEEGKSTEGLNETNVLAQSLDSVLDG
jgi:hypothetical protein